MSGSLPIEQRVRRNRGGERWLRGLSVANLDALQADARSRSDRLVDMDLRALVNQLGGVLANVSGGRLVSIGYVVYLPVSSGYVVAIELDPYDTYTVRRLLIRGGRIFKHGVRECVFADELAETAIRAGSFKSYGDDWMVQPSRDKAMGGETVTLARLEALIAGLEALIEEWERSKRYQDFVARSEGDERAAANGQTLGLCIGHLREMVEDARGGRA